MTVFRVGRLRLLPKAPKNPDLVNRPPKTNQPPRDPPQSSHSKTSILAFQSQRDPSRSSRGQPLHRRGPNHSEVTDLGFDSRFWIEGC
uniref:Uncharacterized protein n=1 Tax=Cannabis sativa TaxID=3483 RepID=A0A803PNM3_CANSA